MKSPLEHADVHLMDTQTDCGQAAPTVRNFGRITPKSLLVSLALFVGVVGGILYLTETRSQPDEVIFYEPFCDGGVEPLEPG